MKIKASELFGLGGIVFLLIGTILLLVFRYYPKTSIVIQLHDTYYVIDHGYLSYLFAIVYGLFAIIYFLFRKITGRYMTSKLSRFHFWSTTIALPVFVFMLSKGSRGQISIIILPIFCLLVISQLVFIINLFYSFWKGEKI